MFSLGHAHVGQVLADQYTPALCECPNENIAGDTNFRIFMESYNRMWTINVNYPCYNAGLSFPRRARVWFRDYDAIYPQLVAIMAEMSAPPRTQKAVSECHYATNIHLCNHYNYIEFTLRGGGLTLPSKKKISKWTGRHTFGQKLLGARGAIVPGPPAPFPHS